MTRDFSCGLFAFEKTKDTFRQFHMLKNCMVREIICNIVLERGNL
jgi:hypothetical protein